jgi:CMP-N,N'-diacetyllegionaminic acid synthase
VIGRKTVLAVITARGGSKGLPGKNIRPLAGKPMLAWTIEAARTSRYVDRVIVSTDDDAIASVAATCGAEVPFRRPPEQSGDTAQKEDAVRHAMLWMAEHDRSYDYITHLTPANPLRTSTDVDRTIELLDGNPAAEAVMTVVQCEKTPLFANQLPPDRSLNGFIAEEIKFKNRQELPVYYQLAGSVSASTWESFLAHRSFLTPRSYALIVGERTGVDVDSLKDFLMAELYFNHPEL